MRGFSPSCRACIALLGMLWLREAGQETPDLSAFPAPLDSHVKGSGDASVTRGLQDCILALHENDSL